MAQPEFAYRAASGFPSDPWGSSRSPVYSPAYSDAYQNGFYENGNDRYRSPSVTYTRSTASSYHLPAVTSPANTGYLGRSDSGLVQSPTYISRPASAAYTNGSGNINGNIIGNGNGNGIAPRNTYNAPGSQNWDQQGRYSPSDSMDDIVGSSSLSDYSLDTYASNSPPGKAKTNGKNDKNQRRPSNRDEFDGPHQFLTRPPADYIAMQERELPHLPTNLLVQEQDNLLNLVNDRLSKCAFDFVAKYQFPIPLSQDMRPVERPQDREWTEWVYLLKRLATKRRIPARVLYNGQIKQFVTILENSLEMRHAAKHQSRPLKDDRNILQLISAGIQVAKILKDAQAMEAMDRLYVTTERQIQERAAARFR